MSQACLFRTHADKTVFLNVITANKKNQIWVIPFENIEIDWISRIKIYILSPLKPEINIFIFIILKEVYSRYS